jgi:enamine deaminase RidA (YjgF/YER057c/UK114 family)
VDPRTGVTVPEETDDAFPAQVRMCYDIIKAILGEVGSDAGAILRLDCYIRDITRSDEDAKLRKELLGDVACASTVWDFRWAHVERWRLRLLHWRLDRRKRSCCPKAMASPAW